MAHLLGSIAPCKDIGPSYSILSSAFASRGPFARETRQASIPCHEDGRTEDVLHVDRLPLGCLCTDSLLPS